MQKKESHATQSGRAHIKHTGGYNELTTKAVGKFDNDSTDSARQNKLVPAKNKTASASTMNKAIDELGWK